MIDRHCNHGQERLKYKEIKSDVFFISMLLCINCLFRPILQPLIYFETSKEIFVFNTYYTFKNQETYFVMIGPNNRVWCKYNSDIIFAKIVKYVKIYV
jgi:hypothetical protein